MLKLTFQSFPHAFAPREPPEDCRRCGFTAEYSTPSPTSNGHSKSVCYRTPERSNSISVSDRQLRGGKVPRLARKGASSMRNSVNCLKRIGVLVGLTLAAVLIAHAQAAPAQGAPPTLEGKTAEQVYKSIKVLNGVPADQVIESMHLIRGALGVSCEFCHEDPDRAADTKENKETARMMMRMVMDINKNNFKGEQEVTCYTCHRGQAIPATTFSFPVVENGEEVEAKGLPSVDQILAKYVAALGGEQAIRKVN